MFSEHHPKLHYISLKNAWQGVIFAAKTQRNFRLEVTAGGLAVVLGYYLEFSLYEMAVVFALIFLVVGFELLNTAIEAVVDSVHIEENNLARISKDAAAAAVLLISLLAAVIGIVLFLPPIIARFF